MRKVSTQGTTTTTDYVDGIQYTNGVIDFIQTEEGIAFNSGGSYIYRYNLGDHLGNVRATFQVNGSNIEVLQRDNYYAFGLRKSALNDVGAVSLQNKYLYNGKELQDELEQYDYGARFYDPVIGRFNNIDPLSEISRRNSPYNYALNSPIRFIDVDGMYAGETGVYKSGTTGFSDVMAYFGIGAAPPTEYYIDAFGNKTKVSDKGGYWYDYYNYASGTTNPLSGKTVAVGTISGEVLDVADYGKGKIFPIPNAYENNTGRIDSDYSLESLYIGGKVLKPIFLIAGE